MVDWCQSRFSHTQSVDYRAQCQQQLCISFFINRGFGLNGTQGFKLFIGDAEGINQGLFFSELSQSVGECGACKDALTRRHWLGCTRYLVLLTVLSPRRDSGEIFNSLANIWMCMPRRSRGSGRFQGEKSCPGQYRFGAQVPFGSNRHCAEPDVVDYLEFYCSCS